MKLCVKAYTYIQMPIYVFYMYRWIYMCMYIYTHTYIIFNGGSYSSAEK